MALKIIADPGHAWLEVPLSMYPDALDYGTGFGYLSDGVAYLEEDCEAPAFLKAHPEIDRSTLIYSPMDDDWPGRRLPRIPDAGRL